MQVDGAAHGVGTIPRRRRLNVLLAIVAVVVIAAIVVLMVWAPQLSTSGGWGTGRQPQRWRWLCRHP